MPEASTTRSTSTDSSDRSISIEHPGVAFIVQIRHQRSIEHRSESDTLKRSADVLGVTSDHMLVGAATEAAGVRFEDRELLKHFQEFEQLPDEGRNVVQKLLDAFLTKKQLQALTC